MRSPQLQTVWRCLQGEARMFGSAHPTSRLFDQPGILASIVPSAPDRSMFNWIVAEDDGALETHYAAVARAYEDAGVRAFSIWVDAYTPRMKTLAAAWGHVFDGAPRAMLGELATMRLVDVGDLDCRETGNCALVARINDAAYGFPPPAFEAALASLGPDGGPWRVYEARIEQKAICGLLTWDGPSGDLGICAVATLPEARGLQVASRLLSFALREAHARGLRTTSLQATSKGKGLYARLGYEDIGALEMWERRQPPPS